MSETACERPPAGWTCSRESWHDGPCAASPVDGPQPMPYFDIANALDEIDLRCGPEWTPQFRAGWQAAAGAVRRMDPDAPSPESTAKLVAALHAHTAGTEATDCPICRARAK